MKYTTFKTVCSKCDKKISTHRFNVSVGAYSFQLCPKHTQELIKKLSIWLKWKHEEC